MHWINTAPEPRNRALICPYREKPESDAFSKDADQLFSVGNSLGKRGSKGSVFCSRNFRGWPFEAGDGFGSGRIDADDSYFCYILE